jgi:hypothetical protein
MNRIKTLVPGMIADKIYCPRLLIVSGSGKKAGKTTLVSSIVRAMKNKYRIVAIKISPHFHPVQYDNFLYHEPGKFTIYEENSLFPENDSSKMKQSGAYRVFYIQVKDIHVWEAFLKSMDYVDVDSPVICESGSLGKVIDPGLSAFVSRESIEIFSRKLIHNLVIVNRDDEQFRSVVDQITYRAGQWEFQNQES